MRSLFRCRLIIAFGAVLSLSANGWAQPTVYWVNDPNQSDAPEILRADVASGIVETVFEGKPFRWHALNDVAIDPIEAKMYWGVFTYTPPDNPEEYENYYYSLVVRSDLDGTNLDTVAISPECDPYCIPNDIDVDPVRRRVYFTTASWDTRNATFAMDLDGANVDTMWPSDCVAVEPSANVLFEGRGTQIVRTTPAGELIDTVASTPFLAGSLALDLRHNAIYWIDFLSAKGRRIMRQSLEKGSTSEKLVEGLDLRALALDTVASKIYFHGSLSGPSRQMYRADLDGSNIEALGWAAEHYLQGLTIYYGSNTGLAMDNESILPGGHSLAAAYPNPFNPTTSIEYTLISAERISVKVRNPLGQLVAVLVDEIQPAGSHRVQWNADSNTPSGTYFYTLETDAGAVTRSVTLVK